MKLQPLPEQGLDTGFREEPIQAQRSGIRAMVQSIRPGDDEIYLSQKECRTYFEALRRNFSGLFKCEK